MKRAAFRIEFGPPPASTVPSYQACCVGCVGGLGVLRGVAKKSAKTQTRRPFTAITQARSTSAISRRAPRGYSGTMLGRSAREVKPSLPASSWPDQASVPPLYYVIAVTARGNRIKSRRVKNRSGATPLRLLQEARRQPWRPGADPSPEVRPPAPKRATGPVARARSSGVPGRVNAVSAGTCAMRSNLSVHATCR